jgi:hypothetical protein
MLKNLYKDWPRRVAVVLLTLGAIALLVWAHAYTIERANECTDYGGTYQEENDLCMPGGTSK